MEFIDRLNTLLNSLADILNMSRNQFLVLLAVTVLLAALFVRYAVRKLKGRPAAGKDEDQSLRESSQSERLLAEQVERVSQLLASQQEGQRQLAEILLLIRTNESESDQQLATQVSFLTEAIGNLSRQLETGTQAQITTAETSDLDRDWRNELPQDAEARVAALEERRNFLFSAIRECNQALEEARRRLVPVPPGTPLPRESEMGNTETDSDEDTQTILQEAPEEQDSPETVALPPAPPIAEVAEADFAFVLPEDFEREFLRLILREDGRPDSDNIRLVLGTRFQHVVQDEINERAQSALQDDLLYEEDGRLVVTEEFVDDLKRFLNERAIPARRV